MFYNSSICVKLAVGSLYITPRHINWRVPSATHVACCPVSYIFSPIYLYIFVFFNFSSSAFDLKNRISSEISIVLTFTYRVMLCVLRLTFRNLASHI